MDRMAMVDQRPAGPVGTLAEEEQPDHGARGRHRRVVLPDSRANSTPRCSRYSHERPAISANSAQPRAWPTFSRSQSWPTSPPTSPSAVP